MAQKVPIKVKIMDAESNPQKAASEAYLWLGLVFTGVEVHTI